MVPANLRSLLLVPRRRHSRLEVATRGPLRRVALRQSQHVLYLDVLQVLLDDGLRLLLVMTGRQIRAEKLLRVVVLTLTDILSSEVEHGSWADPLSGTELLLHAATVWLGLLHLLHLLQVLLLLLQAVFVDVGDVLLLALLAGLVVMVVLVFRVAAMPRHICVLR